jgi:hypothetical protein
MGQPIQPPGTPSSGWLRSFVLTLVAATTGSAIAISAAFGIWYWSQPNFEGLPEQVRTSMNEYISDTKQLRETGVRVTAVTVMHTDGNLYEGQATATNGTVDHQVMVHVAYDGDTMLWSTALAVDAEPIAAPARPTSVRTIEDVDAELDLVVKVRATARTFGTRPTTDLADQLLDDRLKIRTAAGPSSTVHLSPSAGS